MSKRLMVTLGVLVTLALTLIPLAPAAYAQSQGTTLAQGFNGPQGILVDPAGNVWVIDSGLGGDQELPFVSPDTGESTTATFGQTARVVKVAPDGTQTEIATLPSLLTGQEALGGARLALLDGTLYATSGGWLGATGDTALPNTAAVVKIADGQVSEAAQTWPLEKNQNPDGFVLESHPYGLTAGPDGKLWVADAGANTLLKVDPSTGQVDLVAVFDGVPAPFPNPNRGNAMESDPVPTAVAFDRDGNTYVSFLPGVPFAPGAAKVVKVTADGQVSDYATGLTVLTDMRTGPDGELYAVQMAEFTEQGPTPNTGAILRIRQGGASEVLISGLSFPTSFDFTAAGDAYVAINGVGAPGSGAVVRFTGVTAMQAMASPSETTPESLPTTGGALPQAGWILAGIGVVLLVSSLVLIRRQAPGKARKD